MDHWFRLRSTDRLRPCLWEAVQPCLAAVGSTLGEVCLCQCRADKFHTTFHTKQPSDKDDTWPDRQHPWSCKSPCRWHRRNPARLRSWFRLHSSWLADPGSSSQNSHSHWESAVHSSSCRSMAASAAPWSKSDRLPRPWLRCRDMQTPAKAFHLPWLDHSRDPSNSCHCLVRCPHRSSSPSCTWCCCHQESPGPVRFRCCHMVPNSPNLRCQSDHRHHHRCSCRTDTSCPDSLQGSRVASLHRAL